MPDYFSCIGDNDMDGFTVSGGDCNDFDASINPNAIEIEGDEIDQNCDGLDFTVSIEESWLSGVQLYPNRIVLTEQVEKIEFYSVSGALIFEQSIEEAQELMLNFNQSLVIMLLRFKGGGVKTKLIPVN